MISKPKYQTTALIPTAIDYRPLPCVWHVKKTSIKHRWNKWLERHGGRGGRRRQARKCFFAGREERSQPLEVEPWSLREDFLSLKTEADFLRFLNQVGRFSSQEDDSGSWELNDFKGWQQVFREFLRRSPATWDNYLQRLREGTPEFNAQLIWLTVKVCSKVSFYLRFDWQALPHSAVIRVQDVVTAILATIHIDHLRGAKFGFCARPDCRRPFEIVSKHERKYCSQYCAHLESLRRMRERQMRERRETGWAQERSRTKNKV